MKMKALTLWQPRATLVAIGAKRIETRSWSTVHRGPLAIHAAKTRKHLPLFYDDPFLQVLRDAGYKTASDLPLGCVVATCKLWKIKPDNHLIASDLTVQEIAFGDYSDGRFAWFLYDVVKVERRIPARGYQGLWNIEIEVAK